MLSYLDENSFDVTQEGRFLKEKAESANEIEIVAVVDNAVVEMAGIEAAGAKYKVRHRAGPASASRRNSGASGLDMTVYAEYCHDPFPPYFDFESVDPFKSISLDITWGCGRVVEA